MNHSSERMLTTHTGSLARPLELIQAMQLKERGQDYDTVRAVAETGVDLISIGGLTHSVDALDISLDLEFD